ncbi:glycosyltransferase family 2 protein [Bacteroides sp. An51A]|uniref:glycosyltransferase family 2 protein n=1 Tax=Bacteroides sp. An51A TaxID=1965640 RepID=UPI000B376686|nr:glycosyltransferase family 2 protein [Bacteroides sp. An51A]OUN78199.1 hypothetical protein B5G04_16220 [Bacteroides sp. An51A]
MRLSIVIPVYNVEKYIEKCICSVVSQDISNEDYEVLILNDGSTDCSKDIAERYAKQNSNVHLFNHSNMGLSATRNRGLREAKGDYVWFIDSDDWIENNCLGDILKRLESNPDVLSFSGMIPEGKRKGNAEFYGNKVTTLTSLYLHGMIDPVQFYIYNRNFLLSNKFFFKENIKHEDTLFTPITLYKVKNIVFYRKPVYHWLYRQGSITSTLDMKRVKDISDNIQILYQFATDIAERDIRVGFFNKIAHRIIEMLNYGIDNGKAGEEYVMRIMDLHPEYWNIMKNALDIKPRIIYKLIRYSPLSFIDTYRILVRIKSTLNNFLKIPY